MVDTAHLEKKNTKNYKDNCKIIDRNNFYNSLKIFSKVNTFWFISSLSDKTILHKGNTESVRWDTLYFWIKIYNSH